jgi:hypothetical protein
MKIWIDRSWNNDIHRFFYFYADARCKSQNFLSAALFLANSHIKNLWKSLLWVNDLSTFYVLIFSSLHKMILRIPIFSKKKFDTLSDTFQQIISLFATKKMTKSCSKVKNSRNMFLMQTNIIQYFFTWLQFIFNNISFKNR